MRARARLLALLATAALTPPADAQGQTAAGLAGGLFPIDLPTTLPLAGAQSLDVQIARERLRAAQGSATSAAFQFLPFFLTGASYRRHGGLTQDVVGNIVEADKDSYTFGGAFTLQVDVGDALYKTL